jgi:hypothetical protein
MGKYKHFYLSMMISSRANLQVNMDSFSVSASAFFPASGFSFISTLNQERCKLIYVVSIRQYLLSLFTSWGTQVN